MNNELEDIMVELEYIKHEGLQLQLVEPRPENRIKELQEGLNIIKQKLDQHDKLNHERIKRFRKQ